MIVQGVLEVLILHVVIQVVVESRVIDSVYVDMSMDVGDGFSEGAMSLDVGGVGGVKILWLVAGFGDGQCLFDPVNGRIRDTEPGESKDNVFSVMACDVERCFWAIPSMFMYKVQV